MNKKYEVIDNESIKETETKTLETIYSVPDLQNQVAALEEENTRITAVLDANNQKISGLTALISKANELIAVEVAAGNILINKSSDAQTPADNN